jgi:hypothetical protein
MTLRMVLHLDKGAPSVSLHGWLHGPEVAEFERVVAGSRVPLEVDVRYLMGADRAGLAALRSQRLRLRNASHYVSLLLDSGDPPGDW